MNQVNIHGGRATTTAQTPSFVKDGSDKGMVKNSDRHRAIIDKVSRKFFARAKTRIHTFAHPKGEPRISLTTDVGWT
jgi:hypothetical protein